MRKELEKTYSPHFEDGIYARWLEEKYFHAEVDPNKQPYSIVIPPPNITGQLHMGHALNNTIQDILIRMKRMEGYSTLWMPGTDHASISTEVKIVDSMAAEGLTKDDVGREGFLKRAWDWNEKYGGTIVNQLKKLGSSCDFDRIRFTMDEGLSEAVLEVFVRLYNEGYIYRGEKLINWCPKCQTTISDAEVEHEDKNGSFWHFKYRINGTDEYIQFATTRPETMLGDTAVAVNPKDKRFTHLVGKTVTVPIVNREIPIIADEYVEMDFGTGVVKITPAHDPNDFMVGERHGLARINIFNDDGTLNRNAGRYEGLDRFKAREEIIKEFKELGLFIKTEAITHAVGVHDRCSEVIEPLIKLQWFVKMEELAKPAIDAYKTGKLNFVSERFAKVYMNWLDNIKDWCISRQLWWGHRIPAYYCQKCGHIEVSKVQPTACSKCGAAEFKQDEDSLDTWFSSALWPFSTMGWPKDTKELEYFYPTNVIVTAYEIIFFWVIRMVFSGLKFMGDVPFRDVLIHGIVRDSQGRKMSKSLGNGIDPLEVIEQYGADALRLTLVLGSALENDSRFYYEKMEANRNFLNKVWNASRFVMMNLGDSEPQAAADALTPADKWILSKANRLVKLVTDNINGYELGIAVQDIYNFVWDEFCDWYIEMVKPRLFARDGGAQAEASKNAALWTLKNVLITSLKLLHPFMPFVTEEIFLSLQDEEKTIMLSKWPVYDERYNFADDEKEIELLKEAVKGVRSIRAEKNVPPSKKLTVIVTSDSEAIRGIFERGKIFFATLSNAGEILIQADKAGVGDDAVSVVLQSAVIYVPLSDVVDVQAETARLNKEKARLSKEVERATAKLANEGFVAKAPEAVIVEEKEKLEKYRDMLVNVEKQIEAVMRLV